MKKYDYFEDVAIESKFSIFAKKAIDKIIDSSIYLFYLTKNEIKKLINDYKNKDNSTSNENKSEENKQELVLDEPTLSEFISEKSKNISHNKTFLKSIATLSLVLFVIIFISGFAIHINSFEKNEAKFCLDATSVCSNIVSTHGTSKTEKLDEKYGEDLYRLCGLSYARQMDFDNDNSPELIISYDDGGIYYVEVWGYDKDKFVKYYSDTANLDKNNINVGSWITLYHKNSKYYIGKMSQTEKGKMDLYSLDKNQFVKSKTCEYDPVQELYAFDGKINTNNFETIKLSFLSSKRAERTIDAVFDNLDMFGANNIEIVEKEQTEEEKKNSAYYNIIDKHNIKYGKASIKKDENTTYATGLCGVSLIDFNKDKNDELLLVYRYDKKFSEYDKDGNLITVTKPQYKMEIYSWDGSSAKLSFEQDGLTSTKADDKSAIYYILQNKKDKINLCSSTYIEDENTARVWTALSHIYSMNENNLFDEIYKSKIHCNYGYMKYYINDEKVTKNDFKEEGVIIPYFLTKKANYDTSEFSVYFLQGNSKNRYKIENVISDTISTIKQLNPNYNEKAE